MNISTITINRDATVRDALALLERTSLGILLLVDDAGAFDRTVTDGDLRRILLSGADLDGDLSLMPLRDSIVIAPGFSRREALTVMQRHNVNHLPVVNAEGNVMDLLVRAELDHQILLSTPHMGESELDFIEEAFRTNWIAPLGPNVDAFEREVAELVGASHAVALSSGTAAIHLALRMLDVGPGDSVFCSTLTFAASANPILYQGAEPVFIDSEPQSWNMSPVALERALAESKRQRRLPKAVIVVCLYGQSADMDPILALCDQYGVPVVEDSAESLGAKYKGQASGTLGRFGIYSFNGNKIITTSGGGMLITESKEFADKARFLATQARDPAPYYQHSTIGYNYRMSNVLAGIGRGQLQVLGDRVESRRAVFATYMRELSDLDWLEWMPEPNWSYSTHWLSAATIKRESSLLAKDVIAKLADDFVEARFIWKPMHLQPVFSQYRYFSHGNTSVSDDIFERGICLPSGSNLEQRDVERVCAALRSLVV